MLEAMTEIVGNVIGTIFPSRSASVLKKLAPRIEIINALEARTAKLTDRELRGKAAEFRKRIAEIRAGDPEAVDNLKVERYLDEILPEAFALVREAGKRALGMRHFDVQLIGGMVLHGHASPLKIKQNRGMISEMVTGEGKTLVATLPCYLNALQRLGDEYAYVHVVTVNDYLAKRDSDWNRPVFELLGMTCGAIQSNMESFERHDIYSRDIVYGTNSEFGFDYLRDNMKMDPEKQCQKMRHMAIVDEVDSILIDEARTPLIISGGAEDEMTERYKIAAQLVQNLTPTTDEEKDRIEDMRLQGQFEEPQNGHYVVDEKDHSVTLTVEGIRQCEQYLKIDNMYAGKNMEWQHYVDNALKAKELYQKDDEYIVAPGRDGTLQVVIVDEHTGHMMYGRRWSDGLHQAVEAKEILAGEKIEMEAETHTLATITIQNFFKMYRKLAGMTGTALTESREFGQIYKLEVCSIPTNRPMRRVNFPDVIYGSEKEKWEAICQEIEDVNATGRPILVGTTSVEKSEMLAGLLERRGLKGRFELLNAKQHAKEAVIVEKAGKLGAITVATNMAGRGTDIVLGRFTKEDLVAHWQKLKLAPERFDLNRPQTEIDEHLIGFWLKYYDKELFDKTPQEKRKEALDKWLKEHNHSPLRIAESVKEMGGLHIIGSERHEARRIDNQLRGRSGRQGDPGSSRFFLSLDDDLMRIFAKDWVRNFLKASGMKDGVPLESRMVSRSIEGAQRKVEEHHFGTRKRLLEYDEVMNEQRKLIYGLRQKVLEGRELRETMSSWIEDVVAMAVERECPEGAVTSEGNITIVEWAKRKFAVETPVAELNNKGASEIEEIVVARVKASYEEKEKSLGEIESVREKGIRYSDEELKLPVAQLAEVACGKIAAVFEGEKPKVELDSARVKTRIESLIFGRMRAAYSKDVQLEAINAAEEKRLHYTDDELILPLEQFAAIVRKKAATAAGLDPAKVELDLAFIKSNAVPTVVPVPYKEQKMRLIERFLLLDIIDSKWKGHLYGMDTLREGIYLRGFAQKDPKLEYKREGFQLFEEMFTSMKEQATDMLLKMEMSVEVEKQEVESVWNEDQAQAIHEEAGSMFSGTKTVSGAQAEMGAGSAEMAAQSEHGGEKLKPVDTIRKTVREPGPNDSCPCGSGKKYKKCHGPQGGWDGTIASRPTREHKGEAKIGG